MAVSVRLLSNLFYTTSYTGRVQAFLKPIRIVRGHEALVAATPVLCPSQHIQGNVDIYPINWDCPGENMPDVSVAGAWDYNHLSDEVVEADFTDAATYRMIVSSLPICSNNIKQLRAFRDNVTRKLAPTIARAASLEGILLSVEANRARPTIMTNGPQKMALVDGHAASRLGPHFLVQPRRTPAPCSSTADLAVAAAAAATATNVVVSDLGGPGVTLGSCQALRQEEVMALHDSMHRLAMQPVSIQTDVRQDALHHRVALEPTASVLEVQLPSPMLRAVVNSSTTPEEEVEKEDEQPLVVAAAPGMTTHHARRRRRGTGRGSLALAGRRGNNLEGGSAAADCVK